MKATKGGDFTPVTLPEPQTAIARCYSVIDIGTIMETFKDKTSKKRKIQISWEFPTLLAVFNEDKGEQPFSIHYECTASTGDKANFSKIIAQWRGKPLSVEEQDGFDPMTMIGKTGYVSFLIRTRKDFIGKEIKVPTNENSSLKFNGIMAKPKDVECPPARNEYFSWDWDLIAKDGFEVHKAKFEKIPKWLQKKMALSDEFKAYSNGYVVKTDDTDTAEQEPETKVSKEDW